MFVIFCSDPFDGRQPDTAYADEVAAVRALSGTDTLIDYEALVDGHDPARAVRRVAARPTMTLALYRGWMLRPVHYERLYAALSARHVQLINDPEAYRHAHHFPESFDVIAAHTPASVWLPTDGDVSTDRVMEALRPFGTRPVVIKDFVKSQKHYWAEACFIPSASDRQAVERVVSRFLALQGPDLEGGLVFREFLDLAPVATHSRSGMPLTKEYRLFFLDGELIYTVRYWDEGDYTGGVPPPDLFTDVARAARSRFFTMDVAQRRDGEWIIIELGDGQVAGLPEAANVHAFYVALNAHWPAPQP
jgi:hypothetical protein